MGRSWRLIGPFWGGLGGFLGHLGPILEASWAVLGRLGGVLGRLGIFGEPEHTLQNSGLEALQSKTLLKNKSFCFEALLTYNR